MIYVFLVLWIFSALLLVHERKFTRIILHLSIFSMIGSLCFLLFAAPDVAMAEAVISAFSAIFFIVAFEKYYSLVDLSDAPVKKWTGLKNSIVPLLFTVLLFVLFIIFAPENGASSFLKEQYLSAFSVDVGGENAVTAIYLGYRLYDTLFEALMLLVSIVAIVHLSEHKDTFVASGERNDIEKSDVAIHTIRLVCPFLILFGAYLIVNGHISAGGGFQGGVVLASFFMCRYMVHGIHDIQIGMIIVLKKIIYIGIIALAAFFIFLNAYYYFPAYQTAYLMFMNLFIGMKVACGFLVIFYRFVVFEWK